jgi:hypothetical protein
LVTSAEDGIRSITSASAKVLGFESEQLIDQNFLTLLESRKDSDLIAQLLDKVREADLMLAIAKEYGYSVIDEWMVDEELNVLPCAVYVYNKCNQDEFVWVVIPRRGPLDGAPMTLDLLTRNLILDLRPRGGKVIALSYRDIAILDSFMSGQTDDEIAEGRHVTKGAGRYSLRRMVDASAANSRK